MKEILNAAIEYLSLGWSVIPTGADKRPVCKWEQFQTAPAAMDRVEAWFKPESRNNIAICTGALSNIVVVDADSAEAIARLEKYLGEPPKTVQAKTPRGMHYYFRHPGIEMRNSVSLFQGVDFRGIWMLGYLEVIFMSNETEMPEKIWADEVYWYPAKDDERAGGNDIVPYIRKDAIPSKAEVAREFLEAIFDHWDKYCSGYDEIFPTANKILKEWDDAESK